MANGPPPTLRQRGWANRTLQVLGDRCRIISCLLFAKTEENGPGTPLQALGGPGSRNPAAAGGPEGHNIAMSMVRGLGYSGM